MTIFRQITDQSLLFQIYQNNDDVLVKGAAADNVEDQSILLKIYQDSIYPGIKKSALERINDASQ